MPRNSSSYLNVATDYLLMRHLCIVLGIALITPSTLGQNVQWTHRNTSQSSPSPRRKLDLAYDSLRHVTVLFGGQLITSAPNDETWEWNGTSWTQRFPAGPRPSARWGHALAYDSHRQVVVLFGGNDTVNGSNETWEWNGQTWTQRAQGAASPSARCLHTLFFDPVRNTTVLFGGVNFAASVAMNDTWEWNGESWTQLATTSAPSPRFSHAMAYDTLRNVAILLGGRNIETENGETWEYNSAHANPWRQLPVSGGAHVSEHSLTYDAHRDVFTYVGHAASNSGPYVPEWSPASSVQEWTPRWISGPWLRYQYGFVYDSNREVSVLFGGTNHAPNNVTAELWELGIVCVPPRITSQPQPQVTCMWGTVQFSVAATDAFGPVHYQWQAEVPVMPDTWVDLEDHSATLASFRDTHSPTMTILNTTFQAATRYRAVVTGACTQAVSIPVLLSVNQCCPADYNYDGNIDIFDYFDFLNTFNAGCP